MNPELSPLEADFLAAHLRRHIGEVEAELVRTDKHQLQHALARDVDALKEILNRLTPEARAKEERPRPTVMNVLEAIHTRRAVRAYRPDPVEEVIVRDLLGASVYAPSATNAQPWLFAVVQDVRKLKLYSDRAKAMLLERAPAEPKLLHYAPRLRDERFNIFYDASTLIAIGAAERGTYTEADCWLAAEVLMLAACNSGLGTCPIGFAIPLLNAPDVKKELGFPESGVVVAPIIVGYPSAEPAPVPRAKPNIVSWSR